MRTTRITAFAIAASVALTPVGAFAATASHHPAHHGARHGHHAHVVAQRRHALSARVRAQLAKLAQLRKQIKASRLSPAERKTLIKHVDALSRQLRGVHHHVAGASTKHLAKLDHDVSKESKLVPAERDVMGSLHEMKQGLAAVSAADVRLHHDERRCTEERTGEMREIDTAIVDLEDAQRLLLREVHQLLAADPESLHSLQQALHSAAVESRDAIQDLTAAVEALVRVESHF